MTAIFLTHIKTLLTEATRKAFAEYPVAQYRGAWISMEYPNQEANYPGIWVDFSPTTALQQAGIGHVEYRMSEDGVIRKGTRWRFSGQATFTVVAMSSHERDDFTDEMVRILAFGLEQDSTSIFRDTIDSNDLIAVNMQWSVLTLSGKAETPGTPWGTPDVVYEMTVSVDCQGEFVSDLENTVVMVPLSAIEIVQIDTVDGNGQVIGSDYPPGVPPTEDTGWQ